MLVVMVFINYVKYKGLRMVDSLLPFYKREMHVIPLSDFPSTFPHCCLDIYSFLYFDSWEYQRFPCLAWESYIGCDDPKKCV